MKFAIPRGVCVLAAALAAAFLGCEGEYARPAKFATPADADRPDCRIGVWTGRGGETLVRQVFPNAALVPVEEPRDAFMMLLAGKLEAFVADEHVLGVGRRAYPLRFRLLEESLERDPAVALVSARNTNLLARVNRFIADCRHNGTHEQMRARWCDGDTCGPMPSLPEASPEAPVLRVGTSGLVEPLSFLDTSGQLAGFDIEFARRLAFALGCRVRFVLHPDGAFDGELRHGDIDLAFDNADTAVPRKGIAFTDGYLDSDTRVMVAELDPGTGKRGVAQMLEQTPFGVTDALVRNPWLRLFLNGFLNTAALFLLAMLIGGFAARHVRGRPARTLAALRWVPPPILVLLLYEALLPFAPAQIAVCAALALWYAAFLAGDAARPVSAARVALLHWTCLAGLVNVFDLTMATDLVCGRSLSALVPLLGVAAAYAFAAVLIAHSASSRCGLTGSAVRSSCAKTETRNSSTSQR